MSILRVTKPRLIWAGGSSVVPLNVVSVSINVDGTVDWAIDPALAMNLIPGAVPAMFKINGVSPSTCAQTSPHDLTFTYPAGTFSGFATNTWTLTLPAITDIAFAPYPTVVGTPTGNCNVTVILVTGVNLDSGSTLDFNFSQAVTLIGGPTGGFWKVNGAAATGCFQLAPTSINMQFAAPVNSGDTWEFIPVNNQCPDIAEVFLIPNNGVV